MTFICIIAILNVSLQAEWGKAETRTNCIKGKEGKNGHLFDGN